jgi:Phosphotransferase enzyme family
VTRGTLPWDRAGWRESVAAWIDESFTELGIEATGPPDHLRQRPWAAIALVPTAEGLLYFKADPPSESFEPALTLWLAQRRPDVIPSVLRIDAEQGWLLTRDAGTPLREHIAQPPDATIWDDLLPLCAEIQMSLCASVDDLLTLEVPDKRTELLAPAYGDLLSRWPSAATAPSPGQIDALVDGIGDTIPPSLAHEEFQDHNILLREGDPVLIDWAEAAVEHPFCGLVNTFRGLVDRWGIELGAHELLRLRDAYLEPWTKFAPLPQLITIFDLTYPLGMLCRAMTWDRLLTPLSESERAEYASFVPAWLQMAAEALEGKARLGE